MLLEELDYDLPRDLIAQRPADRRDEARLLVLDRASETVGHSCFRDLPGRLRRGDVVVVNETRVRPARLRLVKDATGGRVEALLLKEGDPGTWEALLQPGGRVRAGLRLAGAASPGNPILEIEGRNPSGTWTLRALGPRPEALAEDFGEMPLPHYIRRNGSTALGALDRERYQTMFARVPGSIAAPTAGLHFTAGVLAGLEAAGVEVVRLSLSVGPGTFRPVTAERLDDHRMDAERFSVGSEARSSLDRALREGRRIVAVGTTSTRVLETLGPEGLAGKGDVEGDAELFIRPGYAFRVVGALVTNFHLPRSTPLSLAGAFAGMPLLRRAYAEAKELRYRFLSYGDAMLIT